MEDKKSVIQTMTHCVGLSANQWEANGRTAQTEEGYSKESRPHQAISQNVCNTTKLQPSQDMSADGCSGRSDDLAFEYAHGFAHVDEVQASGSAHVESDADDQMSLMLPPGRGERTSRSSIERLCK